MVPGSDHASADSQLSSLTVPELVDRLREAEETLSAIRNGDVDAVVVGGAAGQQVYTLENADRPYRVLIEEMQEGAITLTADGTILYCNQRFVDLVGSSRESLVGHAIVPFFSASERARFISFLGSDMERGGSQEFTLTLSDGKDVPVNVSMVSLPLETGQSKVICGVVTDLTHSRQRSHELIAANARLAEEIAERSRAETSLDLALEAAGMGSWDLDIATDTARRTLRHDQIFGYDSLLPTWGLMVALEHFVPEDRARVSAAFASAAKIGSIEFEARFTRANDHAVRWLHVKGRTYYDGAIPIRVAGVLSDITDRRDMEEQLRQAQKMEAVGQLTGGIAHDFNNLLMVISGSVDMISRRVTADEKTARLFDAARQGVARGAKLNQQLLAFARRQDLRTEVVNVNDLIPTFEHLLDRAVGETVVVQIHRAREYWLCKTDPHQLETAILNLAINARDAMPNGGSLKLEIANRSISDEQAKPWGASGGDYVVVTLSDTGTGMSSETAARVFEPFFTTKEVGKGTGLGLSQVYGFARQSKGFVTIKSALGIGTSISIHLPRTTDSAGNAMQATAPNDEVEGGTGNILVVEDDEAVRATTVAMLTELGYTTFEAANARSALAILEGGAPVELVFSDIIMPGGMTGVELALEITAKHRKVVVLLTSGYTAQKIVPEHLADEIQLLRKPYTLVELVSAIRDKLLVARSRANST